MNNFMTSRKTLVTGAAGFIGRNLMKALKDSSILSFTGIDILIDSKHDLRDLHNIEDIFKETGPYDTIIHLAALTSVQLSMTDPARVILENIYMMVNLLEAARKYKTRRIIFASSGSVTGNYGNVGLKSEAMPTEPMSPYSASKVACEQLGCSYAKSFNMNFIALRLGNVHGPYSEKKNNLISNLIRNTLGGDTTTIYGMDVERDYIYVEDVINVIVKFIQGTPALGIFDIYNVGTGVRHKTREVIDHINDIIKSPMKLSLVERREGDLTSVRLSPVKLNTIFDGLKITQFEEGLVKTAEWFKNREIDDEVDKVKEQQTPPSMMYNERLLFKEPEEPSCDCPDRKDGFHQPGCKTTNI